MVGVFAPLADPRKRDSEKRAARGVIVFYAAPRRSGAMRADTLFWDQPLNIAKIS
jgi:hypothetical protein